MNRKVVVLQLLDRALYKTIGVSRGQYLGDPINVLSHFSEFEANEVLIMDISNSSSPDFEFLKFLGRQCSMPLSYVGKIRSLSDIQRIITLGFERVIIGEAIFETPDLVSQAVNTFGSSTIGIIINYEFKNGRRVIWRKNSHECDTELSSDFLNAFSSRFVGEIILYCISADGTRSGYDLDVIDICPIDVNINLCGGCASIQEIDNNLEKFTKVSFSAGSCFSLLANDSVFLKYSKDL